MPRRATSLTPRIYRNELVPVYQPGVRNPSTGQLTSVEEYHRTVARNSVLINQGLVSDPNIREYARGPDINQPLPNNVPVNRPEPILEPNNQYLNLMRDIANFFSSNLRNLQGERQLEPNRQRSQRTIIRRNRQILEQNISRLYNVDNEILVFLNLEQVIYLTRNNIINNYYYRKLELQYTIPFIEKFNNLAYNIMQNMGRGVNVSGYRYDIEYFNTIQDYYMNITGQIYRQTRAGANFDNRGSGDIKILKHKSRTIAKIISQITKDISNEKVLLHKYIRDLDVILNPPASSTTVVTNQLRNKIISFKQNLSNRLESLNAIRTADLIAQFGGEVYETKRKNLIPILKSLSILCLTFMILIYKIKFFVNYIDPSLLEGASSDLLREDARNREIMSNISIEMYEAIEYFSRVINHDINVRNVASINEIDNIINDQKTFHSEIKSDVVAFVNTAYNTDPNLRDTINFNIYLNNSGLDSQNTSRLLQDLQNPIFERQRIDAENRLRTSRNNSIIRYELEQAERIRRRDQRNTLLAARRQAREDVRAAAREAAQQAREAARQEREAARQARPVRAARATRPSTRAASRAAPAVATQNRYSIIHGFKNVTDDDFNNKIVIDEINQMFKTSNGSIISRLRESFKKFNKEFENKEVDRIGIYNDLKNKYKTRFNSDEPTPTIRGTIRNYVGYSIPSLFARYIKHDKDMKFNDLSKYMVANLTIIHESGSFRIERQAGIDVGGLRRDFVTALTTELFDPNIGIFITREGTKKYFLNPKFNPNNFYKHIIETENSGYNIETSFTDDFYEFLGKLISFILVNDCGLEHNISSYLTASLCYNTPFTDSDYLYFMFLDFPEYTLSIINLLRLPDPEDIKDVFIGFNDYFNIDPQDIDLTKENIADYLYKCAKFMMTKTILRKDVDNIASGSAYNRIVEIGEKIHSKFIEGIPTDIRDYISSQQVPFIEVNSYLVKPAMSLEIIGKLIDNFRNTMNNLSNLTPYLIRIKAIFIRYVLENNHGGNEANYFKFIENLIRFWSGSSFYKDNEKYKIQTNTNLSEEHLPQSHTCFFLIDLPYYDESQTDQQIGLKIFNKLEIAITNVESGIGLSGGKTKNSKSSKGSKGSKRSKK
jgi:hypothetical protein